MVPILFGRLPRKVILLAKRKRKSPSLSSHSSFVSVIIASNDQSTAPKSVLIHFIQPVQLFHYRLTNPLWTVIPSLYPESLLLLDFAYSRPPNPPKRAPPSVPRPGNMASPIIAPPPAPRNVSRSLWSCSPDLWLLVWLLWLCRDRDLDLDCDRSRE